MWAGLVGFWYWVSARNSGRACQHGITRSWLAKLVLVWLISCHTKYALLVVDAGPQSRHAQSLSGLSGSPLIFANLLYHTEAGHLA